MLRSGLIFFSALYYLPQFFQVALGLSPIKSGLFLLPVLVSQTASSFIAVCIKLSLHLFMMTDVLLRDRLLAEQVDTECAHHVFVRQTDP